MQNIYLIKIYSLKSFRALISSLKFWVNMEENNSTLCRLLRLVLYGVISIGLLVVWTNVHSDLRSKG